MRVLLTCLRSVSKEVIDAFRTTHQRARGLATRPVFYKGDSICFYQACHDCQRVVDIFRWRQVICDDTYKENENI